MIIEATQLYYTLHIRGVTTHRQTKTHICCTITFVVNYIAYMKSPQLNFIK